MRGIPGAGKLNAAALGNPEDIRRRVGDAVNNLVQPKKPLPKSR
jgi:hypothetical protein